MLAALCSMWDDEEEGRTKSGLPFLVEFYPKSETV